MSPDKSPSWSFRGGTLSISQSGDDGRPKSDWKYHHLVKKVAIQGGHAQSSSAEQALRPEVLDDLKWPCYKSLCGLHISIDTLTQLPDSICDPESALTQLSLKGCSSLEDLPAWLEAAKLEVLDLSNCRSLKELPEFICEMNSLHKLILTGCSGLTSLPKCLDRLSNLNTLILTGCSGLTSLPNSLGKLSKLTTLDLRRSSILQQLPDKLPPLETLVLSADSKLVQHMLNRKDPLLCKAVLEIEVGSMQLAGKQWHQLPSNIKGLILKTPHIKYLPVEGWSHFPTLRVLIIDSSSGSPQPQPPASTSNGTTINSSSSRADADTAAAQQHQASAADGRQNFGLDHTISSHERQARLQAAQQSPAGSSGRSPDLAELPRGMWSLLCLEELDLSGCAELKQLPEDLGALSGLKLLDISVCRNLQQLPSSFSGLTSLQELNMNGCCSISRLPSLEQLKKLKQLDLSGCSALARLPRSLGSLTALKVLKLADCTALKELPESCARQKFTAVLKTLELEGCGIVKGGSSLGAGTFSEKWHDSTPAGEKVKQVLTKQRHAAAVMKLATQQEPMLTTLERMSWLVVLLATATFVAYMQPPGGTEGNKWETHAGSCSGPDIRPCALLLFFVLDGLSFGLSIGCVMTIVVVSMPRLQWDDNQAEAGRFYLLMMATWLLLYLAVITGFGAFLFSGLAVHAKKAVVVAPLIPGMFLLILGAMVLAGRFVTLFPGWSALKKACEYHSLFEYWRSRGLGFELRPANDDIEQGQAKFWQLMSSNLPYQPGLGSEMSYQPSTQGGVSLAEAVTAILTRATALVPNRSAAAQGTHAAEGDHLLHASPTQHGRF